MNKKRVIIIKFIMVILVLVFFYSIFNIVMWYLDNKENQEINNKINEIINIPEDKTEEKKYDIDFDKLKEINSDVVAYIKVNNTNINHVVVKGTDNKYYLSHNLNKEYNRSGWIFMDYRNKLDGNDQNIVIYGHNTLDSSMFGTLKKVITKNWYTNSENHHIILIIDGEEKDYQVFSTYSINVEDYYTTTKFKDNNEFMKFIKTLKSRSVYNYDVDVLESDHILTLSTCAGNGNKRMVLHAKEIVVQ